MCSSSLSSLMVLSDSHLWFRCIVSIVYSVIRQCLTPCVGNGYSSGISFWVFLLQTLFILSLFHTFTVAVKWPVLPRGSDSFQLGSWAYHLGSDPLSTTRTYHSNRPSPVWPYSSTLLSQLNLPFNCHPPQKWRDSGSSESEYVVVMGWVSWL